MDIHIVIAAKYLMALRIEVVCFIVLVISLVIVAIPKLTFDRAPWGMVFLLGMIGCGTMAVVLVLGNFPPDFRLVAGALVNVGLGWVGWELVELVATKQEDQKKEREQAEKLTP